LFGIDDLRFERDARLHVAGIGIADPVEVSTHADEEVGRGIFAYGVTVLALEAKDGKDVGVVLDWLGRCEVGSGDAA
jgi:hypothetical protein